MRVGLFIPCYVDQFYPKVAMDTLELLQHLGCEVEYPVEQVCCGQPMANAGFSHITTKCDINFAQNFKQYDYIVCPSGSCVLHLKEHLGPSENPVVKNIKQNIYELSEFLLDILKVSSLNATFPYRVGFHASCHGQRGLHTSSMSELTSMPFSKPEELLALVDGIQLQSVSRDECCGFGGTFCVTEEAVSVKMGKDRIKDHTDKKVHYITSGDMSCLMHLEGILKRQQSDIKVIHLAEILNSRK